jgi:hypothetical protein
MITEAELIDLLDDRVHHAPAAGLRSIRRQGDVVTFVYEGGDEKTIPTGYGDHGLVLFAHQDGRAIAYGQLTSDAAADMGLPVWNPAEMTHRTGIVAITNIDSLDPAGLADCVGPVVDLLPLARLVETASRGAYRHPRPMTAEELAEAYDVTDDRYAATVDDAAPVRDRYVHPAHREPVDRKTAMAAAGAALAGALA